MDTPTEEKPKDHVIVTRVTPVREGGRIVVHAYGPFTQTTAHYWRTKMLNASVELNYRDRLEVSVCKMLDTDQAAV